MKTGAEDEAVTALRDAPRVEHETKNQTVLLAVKVSFVARTTPRDARPCPKRSSWYPKRRTIQI